MHIGKITSNFIFHGILVFGYRGIVLYNTKSRLCSVNANSSSVHLRHFLSKKGVFLRPKTGFFASKPSKPYSHLTIALHPYNNICRHICHCVSCDGSVSSESSVQYIIARKSSVSSLWGGANFMFDDIFFLISAELLTWSTLVHTFVSPC